MFVVNKKDFDVLLKNKIQEAINIPELKSVMNSDNGNSVICGFGYVQVLDKDGELLYQSEGAGVDTITDIRKVCSIVH